MAQALQQRRRWCRHSLAFLQNQFEQGPGRAQGRIARAEDDPVRQALDNQRRQPGLEVEEAADQTDAILGLTVQGGHGHTR
ncbi:hypothetical protein D3C87_2049340 [compost metagenome]